MHLPSGMRVRLLALGLLVVHSALIRPVAGLWPKLYWVDGDLIVRSDFDGFVEEEVTAVPLPGPNACITINTGSSSLLIGGPDGEDDLEDRSFYSVELKTGNFISDAVITPTAGFQRSPGPCVYDKDAQSVAFGDRNNGASSVWRVSVPGAATSSLDMSGEGGSPRVRGVDLYPPSSALIVAATRASGASGVFAVDTGGAGVTVILEGSEFDTPIDVSVDAVAGFVYWLDIGAGKRRIARTRISSPGDNVKTVCNLPVGADAVSITVDMAGEYVYYADRDGKRIVACAKDGSGPSDLITITTNQDGPSDVLMLLVDDALKDPGNGGTGTRRGKKVVRTLRWQDVAVYVYFTLGAALIGAAVYYRHRKLQRAKRKRERESIKSHHRSSKRRHRRTSSAARDKLFVSIAVNVAPGEPDATVEGVAIGTGTDATDMRSEATFLGGHREFRGVPQATVLVSPDNKVKEEYPIDLDALAQRAQQQQQQQQQDAGGAGHVLDQRREHGRGRRRSSTTPRGTPRGSPHGSPKRKPRKSRR